MKIPERERRDWRLTFLILLVGLSIMCLAGEFALKMAPRWSVVADMSSKLDPDATFAALPTGNLVEPVLPEIETPISFEFLTPATNTVIVTATQTFLPRTPSPTLEPTQTSSATTARTPSPTGTRTITPSPTSTPTRTHTPTPTIIRPTWTYSPVPSNTPTPRPTYTPTTPSPGCTTITGSGSYAVSSSGTWFCFQTDGTNNGAILTFSVSDLLAADGAGLLWNGKALDSDPACGIQSYTFSFGSGIDFATLLTVKNNLSGDPLQTYIYVSNVGSGMTSINISVDNASWSTSGTNCPP